MKTTIEEAREYAYKYWKDESEHINMEEAMLYTMDNFVDGVNFSQKWLLIEKDRDGFTTNRQQEEMVNNLPFLLKGENEREELYHELDNDVDKQYYTHWRPLNRK